jgi:serine/threonine protein kinase
MRDTPTTRDPENGQGALADETVSLDHAEGRDAEATVAHVAAAPREAPGGLAKQERDLAFAVALVRAGRLGERDLARTVATWTVHGSESLADCLVRQKVLQPDEPSRFEPAASRLALAARAAASAAGRDLSGTALAGRSFSRIDPGGRISRLLGLASGAELLEDRPARRLASRFTLIRKLGEGGLGTVWLARDENLKRYVAVKEIKGPENADEHVLARFRREAEVTGRLEHPAIVPVYQYGRDEETGGYFYAMRFLGKSTLRDGIAEYHERREAGHDDPMLLHRLLNAFVSLCQAVAHAHAHRVIHRDLKPENVAFDEFGKVILLDWGLAKIHTETGVYDAAGEAEPADVLETGLRGQVVGTPMYMAPEQAAGRLDEIDERTDVYGLGGVLFAILTGDPPHELSQAGSTSRAPVGEILASIVEGPTPRPRDRVATVPPELDAICARALAKKRFLRYQSAGELAEEVERFLAGEPVGAYPEPPARRVRRWIAAHPRLSQVLAVSLLLLVATGATLAIAAQQARVLVAQARFGLLEDAARTLELLIETKATNLARDARFTSELPAIQEILRRRRAQGAAPGAVAGAEPDADPGAGEPRPEGESEEAWKGRLAATLIGLLRGHPEYDAFDFLQLDEASARELIRCERRGAGGRLLRVPEARLAEFAPGPGLRQSASLVPGDVRIVSGVQVDAGAPTEARSPLDLLALTPVFDEQTGRPFGALVIATDLTAWIDEQLAQLNHESIDLTITDATGRPLLYYEHGEAHGRRVEGPSVVGTIPATRPLFAPGSAQAVVHDGTSLYAVRVTLDPNAPGAPCQFGIVARQAAED